MHTASLICTIRSQFSGHTFSGKSWSTNNFELGHPKQNFAIFLMVNHIFGEQVTIDFKVIQQILHFGQTRTVFFRFGSLEKYSFKMNYNNEKGQNSADE